MAIIGAALLAACGTEIGSESDTRPTVEEGRATLTLELTLGGRAAPENEAFHHVASLAELPDGTVWVLDGAAITGGSTPMLRRYGAAGEYLGRVGGHGQGPGEFLYPFVMAVGPDGRVLLRDGTLINRTNVYLSSGTLDTTWTFDPPIAGMLLSPEALQVDHGRTAWFWSRSEFVRVDAHGEIQDTVRYPDLPAVERASVRVTRDNSGRTFSPPYQPAAVSALSPLGYFASAVTSEYRITLHPPPGRERTDPPRTIRHDMPPVTVAEVEREARRATLVAQVEELGGTVSGPIPEVPRVKPPLRSLRFGADGRLWVRVSMPSEPHDGESWIEPVAYDVFEPEGDFLGRVVLPNGARPLWMSGDRVWVLARDDLDVEVLLRYRVTWP